VSDPPEDREQFSDALSELVRRSVENGVGKLDVAWTLTITATTIVGMERAGSDGGVGGGRDTDRFRVDDDLR
jgi:hypothetical protein